MMKYLNLQAFRDDLDRIVGEATKGMSRLRTRIGEAADTGEDELIADLSPYHIAARADLAAYHRVLELLDGHTFNLSNSWGRDLCYMEDQEPPEHPPAFHLSAKVASIVESSTGGIPADPGLVLAAQLVLATVKAFDEWLQELHEYYESKEPDSTAMSICSPGVPAPEVVEEVAAQFHVMFGRPGFLQSDPLWVRQAYAWAYSSMEAPDADA